MKPLFLLLIAVLAFAFGYRFYAKLLALGVFGINDKYSTSAHTRPPDPDYVPTNPYFLLGHHAAAIATGATVAGSVVALVWGWIPAFLWVVTGSAVAAGTYGLGSLWLSARRPGIGIFELVGELVGPVAAYALSALALFVLLALNALAAGLAAQLLADHPQTVLPFWLLAALALGLGTFLHGRRELELIPASAITLLAALGIIWLLGKLPVGLSGTLKMEISGIPLFTLDARSVWVVLLFAYSFYATRAPLWRLSRPRGYLTSLLAIIAVLILFAGMVVDWPTFAAPEFHAAEHAPGVFPWLFVTLTSGALAGFHLLIAHGVSAKQLRRESHARLVGYGGALADGVLALSAVLVAATAFADAPAWSAHYGSWASAFDLPRALALYLDGFARFAAALGLAPSSARVFGAVVLVSLSVATLEAGVRIFKNLLAELTDTRAHETNRPASERTLLHVTTWTGLAFAFADGRGLAGFGTWPLFGSANLLLAGLGFLVLGVALHSGRRPALLAFAPAVFALLLATWGLVMQTVEWAGEGLWTRVAAAIFLLAVELTVLCEAGRRLRHGAHASTGVSAPPDA